MEETVNSSPLNELQSKLKQRFPELKDADLQLHQTSRKEMLQMIGYKLRKTKDEMMRIVHFLQMFFLFFKPGHSRNNTAVQEIKCLVILYTFVETKCGNYINHKRNCVIVLLLFWLLLFHLLNTQQAENKFIYHTKFSHPDA